MEIRLMNKAEYEASKSLWLACFEDDDAAFVDWYYSRRTSPNDALGVFEDGGEEPVAMLHMRPVRMCFSGRTVSVCFVAGVCTHPAYRLRGLCAKLFERAFAIMRLRGYEACVLQPFDTAFYERFGFKTYASLKEITVSGERLRTIGRSYECVPPDPERLFELYTEYTRRYDGCPLRSAEYFKGLIEEYSLPCAYLAVSDSGCCAGYGSGGRFTAYELFGSVRDPAELVALLPKQYERVEFFLPENADASAVLRMFDGDPGLSCRTIPFCMIAPLDPGFDTGLGSMLCFDKY